MTTEPLVFITQNPFKFEEAELAFGRAGILLRLHNEPITELQSNDLMAVVYDKTVRAYKSLGRPVIVEHTGLAIRAWNGMPGALTQQFWDALGGDSICKMVSPFTDRRATAQTAFGYCNGKRLLATEFIGTLDGEIAPAPHPGRPFQWGTIFIPAGGTRAYSEYSIDELSTFSHRAQALSKLVTYLQAERRA
jgi:XTP/dITP diphosphohydrolase